MNYIKTLKSKLTVSHIVWISLFLVTVFVYFFGIGHETFWFDESYSAELTNHSFPDIIRFCVSDSHPPLYYLVLKLFSLIFGKSEAALRSLAAIGMIATVMLGAGPVKRLFNETIAIIYALLLIIIPVFITMAQENRMYTWAAFFVTSAALYGFLAIAENRKKDWILFTLTALSACYTHYYALISTACIFCLMLIKIVLVKKDKINFSTLKKYFLSAGTILVLYLPWLTILIKQTMRVKTDGFWIEPLSFHLLSQIFIFPFDNKFSFPGLPIHAITGSLLLLSVFISGIIISFHKKRSDRFLGSFGIFVYLMTIAIGIVLSLLIRPVLIMRYTFAAIPLLMLSVAYAVSLFRYRIAMAACLLLVTAISLPQHYYNKTKKINGSMHEIMEFIDSYGKPGDVMLHASKFAFGMFCYYYPENRHFLILPEGYALEFSPGVFNKNSEAGEDISSFVSGAESLWLIGTSSQDNNISPEAIRHYGGLTQEIPRVNFGEPETPFKIQLSYFTKTEEPKTTPFESSTLTVEINNFRNDKGFAVAVLYNKFNDINLDNYIYAKQTNIKDGNSTLTFNDLAPGRYSLMVYHDENHNYRYDYNIVDGSFTPVEGINISNNYEKFPDYIVSVKSKWARFEINQEDLTVTIPVFYP